MTRANPSCPNFGMTNELRGVEKKTERVFQLSPFQYPDPNYLNFIQLYSIKVKPSINQPFAILYMSNKYN